MSDRRCLLMQRALRDIPQAGAWPDTVQLDPFTASVAPEAHALMTATYADGGGRVPDFETWWTALSRDAEYAPDLCFPVRGPNGALAAFAQCWTSGFVKDLCVHPRRQGRGIGGALLLHIFHVFQARGAMAVSLKVEAGNARALQFYRSLGLSPASIRP